MKTKLRLLSAIIVLSMIFPLLSGIIQPVFAVAAPIKVYIDSFDKNTATVQIHWDPVSNVDTGNIIYHVPNGTGFDEVIVPITDTTKNTATITKIKSDVIYDFEVSLTDKSSQTFSGMEYFLAQVSVSADQVDQQPVNVAGGGVETGVYPAIKLSWNMPKVYNKNNRAMEYAYSAGALAQIEGSIKSLNFTFHLTSDKSLANVEVKMDPNSSDPNTMYKATVSGDTDTTRFSNVKWDSVNGNMSFYIMGVKDSETLIPSRPDIMSGAATLPQPISTAGDNMYVLPHQEVLPGTVYKITMNTLVTDSADKYVDAVADGLPENPLTGPVDYTYTPIRFQLTKDAQDYIYVRLNRINQGSVTIPKLFYQVQTSNVPSDKDTSWTTRKTLDDGYLNGAYAITVLSGINSKNTVYYRIVAKSESASDKVQSLNLPYKMQDDTARPPVPKEISISKVSLAYSTDSTITDTSSNITITWDKPSNWDQIKNHLSNDIYFHFMVSVNAKDLDITPNPKLEANGNFYGYYPVKYRLVKYISANSSKIIDNGTKLVYTLDGFDLFEGEDSAGTVYTIPNTDVPAYPTYLLPNKTYYLQMYTTLAADRGKPYNSNMSEKSLVTSFTTLAPNGQDVPIPKYLELVENKSNPASGSTPANSVVKLRFDDLQTDNIDWSSYTSKHDPNDQVIYDLYMSTKPDPASFDKTPIGSTEVAGDVDFTKQTLGNTTWVYATINKFTNNNITKFGYYLAPNTTYYFMVKVRLKMVYEAQPKESIQTVLLPVTTPRGEPTNPEDSSQRPLAPTDFAIALDSNGNPMVTGQTVTFEWTVKENAAAYNMISTSTRVDPDTPEGDSSIVTNSVYKSFISIFGNKDRLDDNKLLLDPKMDPPPANFTYDSKTKKCRYTIDTWLYPNKIYYFSLRAEVLDAKGETKSSVWVSIPVTTSLIETPSKLQVVNNCELGFYWPDTNPDCTTESYNIMLKASGDSDYTLLSKSQYTIVKNGSIYYGRLLKLKPNTQYSIKVIRKTDSQELTTITRYTRNDYYQIDVQWQGYAIDPYSGFEIAIKTEDDSDYTVLNNTADLEQYLDITQTTYPYYIEKTNSNLNTNYYTYNARIKMAPTKLPDGTTEHRPLKPNTKYYIKVRATKTDASDLTAVTPSKYIGPVNTRTEFNQGDYDDNDNNTNISAKFLDMMEKLEEEVFWEVNKGSSSLNKIYVKDDKVVNLLEGIGHFSCTIDVSQSPDYINSDEIYMAKNILAAMKSNNKSVIIKTKNAEYTIRPDTFDIDNMEEFKSAKAVSGSADVYLKLNNTQSTSIQPDVPANTTAASKMNVLSAQAVASSVTSGAIKAMIKDRLYNDKTGIIQKKLAVIKNPNNLNTKGDSSSVNKYLNQLFEEVKSEISYYIDDTLNGSGYTAGVFTQKYEISKFSTPLAVKMGYKSGSIANPYVLYGSVGNWQKLTQNLKYENGYLSYFVAGTGKYTIFSSRDVAATVGDDNAAKPYIEKLAANYDLASVFPGAEVSFNSDLTVTVKEGILLYELIINSQVDGQTDVKTKAKNYGLDKIINITNVNRNISRQEASALIIKLYCQRTGADYGKLKASYSRVIKDDGRIAGKYAIPVYACLEMNIMDLDSNSNFNPTMAVKRADMAMAVQKMLEA